MTNANMNSSLDPELNSDSKFDSTVILEFGREFKKKNANLNWKSNTKLKSMLIKKRQFKFEMIPNLKYDINV